MGSSRGYLGQANGQFGAKRIASGSSASGKFAFVKAINGSITFGSGCEVKHGDAPDQGDSLQEGDTMPLPFTVVDLDSSNGVAFAFNAEKP